MPHLSLFFRSCEDAAGLHKRNSCPETRGRLLNVPDSSFESPAQKGVMCHTHHTITHHPPRAAHFHRYRSGNGSHTTTQTTRGLWAVTCCHSPQPTAQKRRLPSGGASGVCRYSKSRLSVATRAIAKRQGGARRTGARERQKRQRR